MTVSQLKAIANAIERLEAIAAMEGDEVPSAPCLTPSGPRVYVTAGRQQSAEY